MKIMKRTISLLLFCAALAMSANDGTRVNSSSTVYLCMGPGSECFHTTSTCRGLNRCSTQVVPVSRTKAGQMHRRPCGWCCR